MKQFCSTFRALPLVEVEAFALLTPAVVTAPSPENLETLTHRLALATTSSPRAALVDPRDKTLTHRAGGEGGILDQVEAVEEEVPPTEGAARSEATSSFLAMRPTHRVEMVLLGLEAAAARVEDLTPAISVALAAWAGKGTCGSMFVERMLPANPS